MVLACQPQISQLLLGVIFGGRSDFDDGDLMRTAMAANRGQVEVFRLFQNFLAGERPL
ncbi:hypothetical protein D3C76_1816370 [compost metagenome]